MLTLAYFAALTALVVIGIQGLIAPGLTPAMHDTIKAQDQARAQAGRLSIQRIKVRMRAEPHPGVDPLICALLAGWQS